MSDWRDPIHPGEQLAEELKEIAINGHELAKRIGLPYGRVYEVLRGERSVTASTVLRLGKFFGTGPEIWLNLQKEYDLEVAREKERDGLKAIKPLKWSRAKALLPSRG